MTTLTDPQARALFDFVFTQVQHLLPDPMPLTEVEPFSNGFAVFQKKGA